MSMVTLQNGTLTVCISTLGAEIQSIRDKNTEYIWQGDGVHWSKHAPVLFPIAGRLKQDTYFYNGTAYSLPQHGFAREREFIVETQSETSVTFLLAGDAAKHPGYPFQFALRARYTLEGNSLRAETIVENLGDTPLYYSAGAHEAYACPEGIESYLLAFEHEEPLDNYVMESGLLTDKTERVLDAGNVLPITPSLFAHDTLVLRKLTSRSVTLQGPKGRRVRVDFPDFDYLLVWTQLGAAYVCIEPWNNLPELAGTDQDITHKPGMIAVAPGAQSALAHTMVFTCEG